jgi:hypothetical protein
MLFMFKKGQAPSDDQNNHDIDQIAASASSRGVQILVFEWELRGQKVLFLRNAFREWGD